MKVPSQCPRCESTDISIFEAKRYEPDVYDPDTEKEYPFHIHYIVECRACHIRTEVHNH